MVFVPTRRQYPVPRSNSQLYQLTIAREEQLRKGGVCVTAAFVWDDGSLEWNQVFQFDPVDLDLLTRSRWAEVILLAHVSRDERLPLATSAERTPVCAAPSLLERAGGCA
jgi:hypothetical protein